mmetsp:Transcript_30359/g.59013  ORF Transcript_30359/g.59013 Transcript_30359/m.59013 type:complete len:127 (-) Transcript_30359:301-681(-)
MYTARHMTKIVNARRTSSDLFKGVTKYENTSPAKANGNMGFRNEPMSTLGSRLIHPIGAKIPTPIICVDAAKATASWASICFIVKIGRKTTPPATGAPPDGMVQPTIPMIGTYHVSTRNLVMYCPL